MKKLFLSVIMITAVLSTNAQEKEQASSSKLKVSVGVETALPLGDFGDSYSFGIGGSVQTDYNFAENFDFTFNTGVITFLGKTVSDSKVPSQTVIPVLIGSKYSVSENSYVLIQAGTAIFTASGGAKSESVFAYSPGFGYKFTQKMDALLKYTGFSRNGENISSVGLRLAYTF